MPARRAPGRCGRSSRRIDRPTCGPRRPLGRWHLYWIQADEEVISAVQREAKRGWYAHFWKGDRLLVVYEDATFDVSRSDRSSWLPAIEHGEHQGIPRDELDFVTED